MPVPSNQIKVTFIIILPFNLVHLFFPVSHRNRRKCRWIIGGGGAGGKRYVGPPSQIIGGGGAAPCPPSSYAIVNVVIIVIKILMIRTIETVMK